MKAGVHERYGMPGRVVEIRELAKPEPGPGEVLVRVRAASVNIADWYAVTGRPWIARVSTGPRRPKESRIGADYAGVVEAVGSDVDHFRPGDEVFGGRTGACAEYVAAKADRAIVAKPERVTLDGAAAVGVAATTALQAIRDHGRLEPGQRVLVRGASGGVGTYAVQSATVVVVGGTRANRLLGPLAHVTASRLASLLSSQKSAFFLAKLGKADMETLRELLVAGKVRSVVDSVYPLDRLADALEHMGTGHPQGKIVVTM